MFCHLLQRLNFKVTRNSFIIFIFALYIFFVSIHFASQLTDKQDKREKSDGTWSFHSWQKIYFHSFSRHSLSLSLFLFNPTVIVSWQCASTTKKKVVTNAVLIFFASLHLLTLFLFVENFLVQLIFLSFPHLNVVGDLENGIYLTYIFFFS